MIGVITLLASSVASLSLRASVVLLLLLHFVNFFALNVIYQVFFGPSCSNLDNAAKVCQKGFIPESIVRGFRLLSFRSPSFRVLGSGFPKPRSPKP